MFIGVDVSKKCGEIIRKGTSFYLLVLHYNTFNMSNMIYLSFVPPTPWGQVPGFTGDACIIFHLSKLLFSGFFRRKSNFFLVKITKNAQIELYKPLTWLKNVWRSITIVLTCLIVFDKILKTSSFYQTFSSFKHV